MAFTGLAVGDGALSCRACTALGEVDEFGDLECSRAGATVAVRGAGVGHGNLLPWQRLEQLEQIQLIVLPREDVVTAPSGDVGGGIALTVHRISGVITTL